MNLADIANIRLLSQQIAGTKCKSAKDIVAWMGAMQAQDYAMVKWAIGVRLPNATEQLIETAINNGEIIRTHLLRPTWHLVSADDIYWLLRLTAPQIKAALKSRHKELALSEAVFTKSNTIIEKALRGREHLTREELMAALAKAKIATDENRSSHLSRSVPQVKLPFGALVGVEVTAYCGGKDGALENTHHEVAKA